jgi:hypothetical protein
MTPRRQNLRRADSGNRLNPMLTSSFDALKKLESGEMKVAHENYNALGTGSMGPGNLV